jgi:hypothetical protein
MSMGFLVLCGTVLVPAQPWLHAYGQSAKNSKGDLRDHVANFEGTRWYGVYVWGKKAGHAKMALLARPDGYHVIEKVAMKIQAFGKAQTILLYPGCSRGSQ